MLEQLILMICVNLQETPQLTQYYTACTNTLTATSIQTHLKSNVETAENKVMKIVTDRTGEKIWGIAAFTYSTYVKQQIIFSTPVKPFADNLNVGLSEKSENFTLTWSF